MCPFEEAARDAFFDELPAFIAKLRSTYSLDFEHEFRHYIKLESAHNERDTMVQVCAKSCNINRNEPLTDHQATVVARGLCPAVSAATLMSHLVAPPENVEKLWDVAVACWRENLFCSHERRVCLPDAPETAMGLGLHAFILPEFQVKFDPENIQVGDPNNNIKSFTNPTLAFEHVKKLLDPSREAMKHADASIPECASLYHVVPRFWALDIERSMRRTRTLKHELIRATWHPSRFFEWCLPIDEQRELLTDV